MRKMLDILLRINGTLIWGVLFRPCTGSTQEYQSYPQNRGVDVISIPPLRVGKLRHTLITLELSTLHTVSFSFDLNIHPFLFMVVLEITLFSLPTAANKSFSTPFNLFLLLLLLGELFLVFHSRCQSVVFSYVLFGLYYCV